MISETEDFQSKRRRCSASLYGADDVRRSYDDALALVQCVSELCPRSAPPAFLDIAMAALLARAAMEDTALAMRQKVYDLKTSTEYVEILAAVWRQLQTHGVGRKDIAQELAAAGVDWRLQDEVRAALPASLRVGWSGVRFQEMLLGSGIGDSFGAGVEFWDNRWIKQHVDGSTYVLRRGDPVLHFYYAGAEFKPECTGAGQNFLAGMYTDDLEMTLGLIHALLDPKLGGEPSMDDMLRHWKEEYFKAQGHYLLTRFWALAGIGRNGHGGIAAVYSGSVAIEGMRARIAKMRYPGNAPPMRALPLAFVRDDDRLVRLARANADSTHPHRKARAASLGVALAGQVFVIQRMKQAALIPEVCKRLEVLAALDAEVLDDETLPYLQSVDVLPGPGPTDAPRFEDFLADATIEALCGSQPVWQGPAGDPPDGMPRMVRGLDADAQRTLGCVLYLLKHHKEGMALQTLLRCLYIGGDVDSLGALCLAMVGGREGLHFGEPCGLPVSMLQHLESAEYIVQTANEFELWAAGAGDAV